MTDKESYVNVADLKRKLRAFAKYRQYSKPATDELLGVVSKLKISIKADLETTLKSTDVQPVKHGRWIDHEKFERKNCNVCIECSVCNTWFRHDCIPKTKFCPNCGARMDGDVEWRMWSYRD